MPTYLIDFIYVEGLVDRFIDAISFSLYNVEILIIKANVASLGLNYGDLAT